jgi:hypothetical protein
MPKLILTDQCCLVRPEARAREFMLVARLRFYDRSRRETDFAQLARVRRYMLTRVESLASDPKPCDLSLGRLKPDFRRVEDRNQF